MKGNQLQKGKESLFKKDDRRRAGLVTSLVGLVANALLAIAKMAIGALSGTLAITADGFNNLTDSIGSLVSVLSFIISARPSDEGHPFGHARFEYIASSAISLLILFVGYQVFWEAIDKIQRPLLIQMTLLQAGVLVGSILVKIWMKFYYSHWAERLSSSVLKANAVDARNDVLVTTGILLSLALSSFLQIGLDGPISLVIALLIFRSGLSILTRNFDRLMGEEADPDLIQKIEEEMTASDAVLEIHNLKIHDYGPGQVYASCDIMVDADLSLLAAHEAADQIERRLEREGIAITIHVDPMVLDDPAVNEMRTLIRKVAEGSHQGCQVFDLQIVPQGETYKIDFGFAVPYSITDPDAQLHQELETVLQALYPDCQLAIRIERYSSNFLEVSRWGEARKGAEKEKKEA